MAGAKNLDGWNAMVEWDKIWLEQQDWLDEQETAFQSRIDDLRAQIQKKYDARLEKAFKLAGKQEERIAALRECHKDFVAWQNAEDAKLDKVIDKAIADFHKKEEAAERKKAKALKKKEKARKAKAKAKKTVKTLV
jgi:hypothetical protein